MSPISQPTPTKTSQPLIMKMKLLLAILVVSCLFIHTPIEAQKKPKMTKESVLSKNYLNFIQNNRNSIFARNNLNFKRRRVGIVSCKFGCVETHVLEVIDCHNTSFFRRRKCLDDSKARFTACYMYCDINYDPI